MTATKTYSTKSNATRAARAVGLGAANCFQVLDGTWGFRALAVDLGIYHTAHIDAHSEVQLAAKAAAAAVPTVAAPAPAKAKRARTAQAAAPAAGTAIPPHKEFALYGQSAVTSPVAYVHAWLNANGKGLTRKEALYALAQAGVNFATARTQYQRWFTANK